MLVFIKSAICVQQISGAAFNIYEEKTEGPAAFRFFNASQGFQYVTRSYELC